MNNLPIHIDNNEEHDDFVDIDLDVIEDLINEDIDLREEIDIRLTSYNRGLETLYAMEEYHTSIYSKESFSSSDIKQHNVIAKLIDVNLEQHYNGFNVGLEGIGSMLNSAAIHGGIAVKVAKVVTGAVVDTVVSSVQISKQLLEKITSGIMNLAAEYELISKLIEKRWFGIKNLIEVYQQQLSKLQDRINTATQGDSSLQATIKVKLNTAKLSRNRKIQTKDDYMKVITEDITDVVTFLNKYTESSKITVPMAKETSKSFAFLAPYKQTMIKNLNLFNNDVLGKLSALPLFKNGHEEGLEIHSRVLIGGKRVSISHNRERATNEHVRKDLRRMIKEMNIYGSRVKGNDNINVEVIVLKDFVVNDTQHLLSLLQSTGEALDHYSAQGVPQFVKDKDFFNRVTQIVSGLASAGTGFVIGKDFLNNGNNLEMVKTSLPKTLLNIVDLFVKAASLTALIALVGAKPAVQLIDWLRKYIISSVFTSMDLQYRITKILNNVDSSVIDTLISVRGQCYRVTDKLSKSKVWS